MRHRATARAEVKDLVLSLGKHLRIGLAQRTQRSRRIYRQPLATSASFSQGCIGNNLRRHRSSGIRAVRDGDDPVCLTVELVGLGALGLFARIVVRWPD